MDEIVRQAIAKWPNVPHCYGWLALDARGRWRMRDERAQSLDLPGDIIRHPSLCAFINRNYLHDAQGRWYFQNGPQRVYVNLELTPYVARTDPAHGFMLHTDAPLDGIEQAWLSGDGQLILQARDGIVAAVDDRDIAQCVGQFRIDGRAADEQQLLDWLRPEDDRRALQLRVQDRDIPVARLDADTMEARFGFILRPQPDR